MQVVVDGHKHEAVAEQVHRLQGQQRMTHNRLGQSGSTSVSLQAAPCSEACAMMQPKSARLHMVCLAPCNAAGYKTGFPVPAGHLGLPPSLDTRREMSQHVCIGHMSASHGKQRHAPSSTS